MIPLHSSTHKLIAGQISPHAFYFTIVGKESPTAFFVNSKRIDDFQFLTALMTAYSKQISAGISIREIIKDMKETFDPNGSYITEGGSSTKVNSFVHHLGLILERHVDTWEAVMKESLKNSSVESSTL